MNLDHIAREAQRASRNHKLEEVGDGRFFMPGANLFMGGVFVSRYAAPGEDFGPAVVAANKVVKEGLDFILNLLGNLATPLPLYLAPFAGNVSVSPDWKGTDWAAAATEFTAYTGGTRPPWTVVASTAQALTNQAALAAATITFAAGGPYTIRGCALAQASAKNAATGKLVAASRYSDDLTGMAAGGKLSLEYSFQALDEGDA